MGTETATVFLSEYLSEVITTVEQHGATAVQVIGDGVVTFLDSSDEMGKKGRRTEQ